MSRSRSIHHPTPARVIDYRQQLLTIIIRWTRPFLMAALVINSLWFVWDFWGTLLQNGGILAVIGIGYLCQRLLRRGQLQRAARIYLASAVILSALVIPLLGPNFALVGVIGLSLFVFLASLLESRDFVPYWGGAAVALYLIFFTIMLRFPLYELSYATSDIIGLYVFPTAAPLIFLFLGRSIAGHLEAALTTSETMQHELEKHRDHLQELVDERTAELHAANEKQREEINVRKQTEEELKQYRYQLEEMVIARTAELLAAQEHMRKLSLVKDEFITNVSHELRTPLANLKLHHHLMSVRPEKGERYMEIIGRETERLEILVEEMLLVSSIAHERVKPDLQATDLNELAIIMTGDRQRLAFSRGLLLKVEVTSDLPTALADPVLVTQSISVLLTNALNYTPEGGLVRVTTHGDEHNADRIGISVCDNGPGIIPGEQQKVFELFYRGSVGEKSEKPGTGLGLAIAREYAEKQGGSVELVSSGKAGEGTDVTLWLPVYQADDKPAHE